MKRFNQNNMKARFGSWITLNHPSIAEIMAGFDLLCIGMEDSVTDYFEAEQLLLEFRAMVSKFFVWVG